MRVPDRACSLFVYLIWRYSVARILIAIRVHEDDLNVCAVMVQFTIVGLGTKLSRLGDA